jgi:putative nucleotide binding protein
MEPITRQQAKEENAVILDFLEHGYPFEQGTMKSPIAQALGLTHLTLLELIPKKGIHLQPHQDVYIGEGKREEIHHIKGRIPIDKLTNSARKELPHVVKEVIGKDETRFVKFFNTAQPLTMRMHQLELLPGLGKKHMWEVINARKGKPFENFEDLKNRVKLIPDPKGMVVKRVLAELEGKEKYKLFVG